MTTLYLCGAGNVEGMRLAITVNRATRRWDHIAVLDDDPAKRGKTILGLTIEGPFSLLGEVSGSVEVVNLVTRTTRGRWGAKQKIATYGHPFAPLIHPNVDTFGTELPEDDITIYEYATISANSGLGEGSVVFNGAITGHGSKIGKGCVLAPGAVVNARVKMGDFAYVGSCATVLPDLSLGEHAVVGAGSSVIEDVPAEVTVMGVPAEILGAEPVAGQDRAVAAVEPDEEIVNGLIKVWQDLLITPDEDEEPRTFDRETRFFDEGGTSILAQVMVKRVEEELGLRVKHFDVFRFPSIGALAMRLTNQSTPAPSFDAKARAAKRRSSNPRRRVRN
ncbi:Carrier domain-containing protein [Sulfidibacter corallicola]|uniref:Carrier domain-containing protein n=1 Tax=Sulfidibacter corallicola TaxID=2818388 RepID=A0A8A4TMS2_SULCO|nr:phosphopantetheine-binding protein [Sulfidibacter corallicola]QTD50850.1 hypothetical protein J3U87_00145 [Sulfidibacter corallicola]